jgi:quercetin dioxygenase-like cupin family protein
MCRSAAAIRGVVLPLTLLLAAAVAGFPSGPARAQPPTPRPGVSQTVLATRFLGDVPADRHWVLRRGHSLNEDAHAHSGGFIYAARGTTYLVIDDAQGTRLSEGQAAWAPEDIGHLHTGSSRASSAGTETAALDAWTILLERDIDARRPGAAAITAPLRGLLPGPYEARLSLLTIEAGAATPLRRVTGPEFTYSLDGSWELVYDGVPLVFGAEQGYLADPGVPHRLRNSGTTTGRLLAAQLVPDGSPPDETVPDPP